MNSQLGLLRSLIIYYANPLRRRQLRAFYAGFIGPDDLCFDIGAHAGNRSGVWAALGARVVAVEPQSTFMAYLRHRYGDNKRVALVEEAVGAEQGTATLYVSERTPTVTTLSREWIGAVQEDASFRRVRWDTAISVPVTTLDELITRYGRPTFCKIDVEGFELEVLRGLSQPVAALSFEYIPAVIELAVQCVRQLETLGGYVFNWSEGEKHVLQRKVWLTTEEIIVTLRDELGKGRSGDIYARLANELED